jgi:hypothetical protein
MGRDVLRIKYEVEVEEGRPPVRWIAPSLWVNDQCISQDEGVVVDMRNLVATLQGCGEYDILTCGCGEPGCADIWQGIIVFHYHDLVRWLIPDPIVRPEGEDEEERIIVFKDRYFQREDYRRTIASAVEEAKQLVLQDLETARVGPYGFSVQDLLDMKVP